MVFLSSAYFASSVPYVKQWKTSHEQHQAMQGIETQQNQLKLKNMAPMSINQKWLKKLTQNVHDVKITYDKYRNSK